jgi:hypothetical protein
MGSPLIRAEAISLADALRSGLSSLYVGVPRPVDPLRELQATLSAGVAVLSRDGLVMDMDTEECE